MGNKQTNVQAKDQQAFYYRRFIPTKADYVIQKEDEDENNSNQNQNIKIASKANIQSNKQISFQKYSNYDSLTLQSFRSTEVEGTDKNNIMAKTFHLQTQFKSVEIIKYFQKFQDLEIYISNLIKISKLTQIFLYNQLKFTSHAPYVSTIKIDADIKNIDISYFKNCPSIEKKLDLLQFVTNFLKNFRNIYICPEYIGEGVRGFYLFNFATLDEYNQKFKQKLLKWRKIQPSTLQPIKIEKISVVLKQKQKQKQNKQQKMNPQRLFLGFLRWIFSDLNFQLCLSSQEMPSNLPIYLQEVYNLIYHYKKLTIDQIDYQLKIIKDKMTFLSNKTDSFYACQFFNKIDKHLMKFHSQWIFFKSKHQIFFYHIKDLHSMNGKIIRKKKKKDIEEYHLAFDPEDLQILYIPQNAKYIVKVSQFQFENCSSISDIQIKYKLSVKFKKCLLSRTRSGDLLLLDQYLYRYLPSSNKLIQQTKRISDYVFLSSTRQSQPFIVKLSIDIFRNGIRVFYKNSETKLSFIGDQKLLGEIISIRVDIRQVIFCAQVYKGVFLMMASKNMWILDLNFECFFSFATPSQIKKLAAFSNNNGISQNNNMQLDPRKNDQIFTILNQSFKVDLNHLNDGNNVAIKDNFLHIIGIIEGHPYYLKYRFIHRIGALRLQGYHPLYVQAPFHQIKSQQRQERSQAQTYCFNFHEQNSAIYKYQNWIFKGKLMVKVFDFKIKIEKTNYQVILEIQRIEHNLKQHIEKLVKRKNQSKQKNIQKQQKTQKLLLLYKIYQIYENLFTNSITHRNISISHICFTTQKQLKIHGWSEPPRNWHVSDYKDYLLVCFNLITCSTYQKLTDKTISKHEHELAQYPIFAQKINYSFSNKQSKTIEKCIEIQKNLQVVKSYLQSELSIMLQQIKTNNYIFSFEYKTPRMSVLNIETQKMKKITIVPEQTISQQFIFNETDKYCWNQQLKRLYIFTNLHQFFQLKINMDNLAQQKLVLEDYEYLPQNISSSGFVLVNSQSLYSFGGIKKEQDGRSTYNKKIYKFNWKLLTWETIGQIPEPRINPQAVVSKNKDYIYLIGGVIEHECEYLKIIEYNTKNNTCVLLVDKKAANLTSSINFQLPLKIFHLSQQLSIFVYWYVQDSDYVVRYVSYTSIGFDIEIRVRSFSCENSIARQSVSLIDNMIHILRPYGKYTKMIICKLQSGYLKNETIYAIS